MRTLRPTHPVMRIMAYYEVYPFNPLSRILKRKKTTYRFINKFEGYCRGRKDLLLGNKMLIRKIRCIGSKKEKIFLKHKRLL